jgi:hypothetical protein
MWDVRNLVGSEQKILHAPFSLLCSCLGTRVTKKKPIFGRVLLPGVISVILTATTSFSALSPQTALASGSDCAGKTEAALIESAVQYFVETRQPNGGITYNSDGSTLEEVYVRYRDTRELKSLNPSCCRIAGLSDQDGFLYTPQVIRLFDLDTTVMIEVDLRAMTSEGVVVSGRRIDRIPMDSCGRVVEALVGG